MSSGLVGRDLAMRGMASAGSGAVGQGTSGSETNFARDAKIDFTSAATFLANVSTICNAWTEMVGGHGGLSLIGKGKTWHARWGGNHDRVGTGIDPVEACIDLTTKMARDLTEWSKEDAFDLAPALAASLSLLEIEEPSAMRKRLDRLDQERRENLASLKKT